MRDRSAHFVRFQTKNNFYIYSRYLNRFYRVSEPTYDLLPYLEFPSTDIKDQLPLNNGDQDTTSKLPIIEDIKKKLYLSVKPKMLKFHLDDSKIDEALNNSLSQITLELTEDCNLRCKYCPTSGMFKYRRPRSNSRMESHTALKAVNYFLPRTRSSEIPPCVGFYGGEPLLNFRVINDTVNHINRDFSSYDIKYQITTNGTLLNRKMMNYFIDNNFSLNISLDGPRWIHDRYRIFPNGKGSFAKVKTNLDMIRSISENYFKKNVKFQCVLAPPFKYRNVLNFFKNDPLFNQDTFIRCSFVDLEGSCVKLMDYVPEEALVDDIYFKTLKNKSINNYDEKDELSLHLFIKKMLVFHSRMQGYVNHYSEYMHPPGICLPGARKLFVDCAGNYHMCEKIEQNMPIGNVDKGLNSASIKGIIAAYCKLVEDDCLKCWAIRLCGLCFTSIVRGGKLDIEYRRKCCTREKKNLLEAVIDYMSILENNKDVFSGASVKVI